MGAGCSVDSWRLVAERGVSPAVVVVRLPVADHPGRLVSQRQLLLEVWGPTYREETNYLRVFIAQIRRKLEPDPAHPRYFITEPGMGYRFQPNDQPRAPDRPRPPTSS
jgi:DNA-binding winged helix-turn-helix (wHTH) protein